MEPTFWNSRPQMYKFKTCLKNSVASVYKHTHIHKHKNKIKESIAIEKYFSKKYADRNKKKSSQIQYKHESYHHRCCQQ